MKHCNYDEEWETLKRCYEKLVSYWNEVKSITKGKQDGPDRLHQLQIINMDLERHCETLQNIR